MLLQSRFYDITKQIGDLIRKLNDGSLILGGLTISSIAWVVWSEDSYRSRQCRKLRRRERWCKILPLLVQPNPTPMMKFAKLSHVAKDIATQMLASMIKSLTF